MFVLTFLFDYNRHKIATENVINFDALFFKFFKKTCMTNFSEIHTHNRIGDFNRIGLFLFVENDLFVYYFYSFIVIS